MPTFLFEHDLVLAGQTLKARRLDGGARVASRTYVPQVAGQSAGSPQLDPATRVTWHRGGGASRRVTSGMTSWGENVWYGDPGLLLPGPAQTTVTLPSQPGADLAQFVEGRDGHLYVVGGRYAYRVPYGYGPPVVDQDLGASFVARSATLFQESIFVGGDGGNLWEKPLASAWTNAMTAGSVVRGEAGTVVWAMGSPAIPTPELMMRDGTNPRALRYVAANPRNSGDWSASIPISPYPITGFIGNRNHIYVATEGGLFDLDATGDAPNLTPEVERFVLPTNGRALLAAEGWVYYGAGYGLLRVRVVGDQYAYVQPCGPALHLPYEGPPGGVPTALARYQGWVILAQYDAASETTRISFGRDAAEGEIGPMTWVLYPLVLPGQEVTAMHVSGLVDGAPRLWLGVTDTTTGDRALVWAPLWLDTPYADLRAGRDITFATAWTHTETAEDWGDDALPKLLVDVVAESEGLGVGSSIAVEVARDGASLFEPLGTLRSNPRSRLPAGTEVLASSVVLRYRGTGQSASPPILRKVSLRAIPRPDLQPVRSYQVVLGHAVRHQGGSLDGRDPKTLLRLLEQLQGPDGRAVAFRDEDGQTGAALVLGPLTVSEVDGRSGDAGETRLLVASFQLRVLEQRGQTFVWDDGTRYDTPGMVWA